MGLPVWCPEDERPEIVIDVLGWKVRESAHEVRIPLRDLLGW